MGKFISEPRLKTLADGIDYLSTVTQNDITVYNNIGDEKIINEEKTELIQGLADINYERFLIMHKLNA